MQYLSGNRETQPFYLPLLVKMPVFEIPNALALLVQGSLRGYGQSPRSAGLEARGLCPDSSFACAKRMRFAQANEK